MSALSRLLRGNLVLVAAIALPAAVALLFVIATMIPAWTVPAPQHDLVLRAELPYAQPAPKVAVEFAVREGRVEALVTPVPKVEGALPYAQRWGLLLFDHASNQVREIPIELPASVPEGETRTVVVDALDGRRVTASTTAPDGYQYDSDTRYGGTGIVGDLFGMGNHYQRRVAVSRSGRRVELDLPAPYRDSYGAIYAVGWIVDGSRR